MQVKQICSYTKCSSRFFTCLLSFFFWKILIFFWPLGNINSSWFKTLKTQEVLHLDFWSHSSPCKKDFQCYCLFHKRSEFLFICTLVQAYFHFFFPVCLHSQVLTFFCSIRITGVWISILRNFFLDKIWS